MAASPSPAPPLPRRRRVLPAVVVAAVVGAAGLTVAIDVVSVQTAGHSLIWPYLKTADHLRTTQWSQTSTVVTAAVVAGVGLVLLLMAVVPGRSKLLEVDGGAPDESVGMPARSVRRTLANAALGVDGVRSADVSLSRNRADVSVDTPLRDPGDLAGTVRLAVAARLAQLELRTPPSVRVKVNRPAPEKETGATLDPSGPAPRRAADDTGTDGPGRAVGSDETGSGGVAVSGADDAGGRALTSEGSPR